MDNGNGITKADLIEALAAQKREITSEIKGYVAEQVGNVRAELAETKNYLTESFRQIETNLLTEFHRYGKGQQVRLHSLEISESDLKMRLAVIEERLMALEARRHPAVVQAAQWRAQQGAVGRRARGAFPSAAPGGVTAP